MITSLIAISPNIQQINDFSNYNSTHKTEYRIGNMDFFNKELPINNVYATAMPLYSVQKKFEEGLLFSKISFNVYRNCMMVLNELSANAMASVETNNISYTDYGTAVIDFEGRNNAIFSLEIGKDSIGYFSDIENKTFRFNDKLMTAEKDALIRSVAKLNNDLLEYLLIINE